MSFVLFLSVMYGRPPIHKAFCNIIWREVGAVMYPACWCGGTVPLAPMVSVAALSNHPDVLDAR
jgi:hypothetical protein